MACGAQGSYEQVPVRSHIQCANDRAAPLSLSLFPLYSPLLPSLSTHRWRIYFPPSSFFRSPLSPTRHATHSSSSSSLRSHTHAALYALLSARGAELPPALLRR